MLGQRQVTDRRLQTIRRLRASPSPPHTATPVVVLANRAPFRHDRAPDGRMCVQRSGGGLVTAVEPLVKACSGVWVAHAAGNADTICADNRVRLNVPPDNPEYRLRYVSITDEEHRGYYYGFANEGLWPLCHHVHVRPVFRTGDFRMYRAVNRRFAAAVCDEITRDASVVFVNDYHFALAPRMVRRHLPLNPVVVFWHIPWPHRHVFRICPWRRELLEGLLGADIIGFQTPDDCTNFLQTVGSVLDCDVDPGRSFVKYEGQTTLVRAYPVGVEWENQLVCTAPPAEVCRERLRGDLGLDRHVQLAVGIDRLDYTKGIDEKFRAIERLLEIRPELTGRFVFVQVAEPSRECLAAYRAARRQLLDTSERVNCRFGTERYRPIILLESHYEPADVYRLYRAADLCYVGSLHDGMNLVAKEFVCARDDERGVLVLSEFTGASLQLTGAVSVNPYAVDDSAQALFRALSMTDTEQTMRMRQMRNVVRKFDTHWWARQILNDATHLRDADRTRTTARLRCSFAPDARARVDDDSDVDAEPA
jgi:trehalose 6-phosphate synthase